MPSKPTRPSRTAAAIPVLLTGVSLTITAACGDASPDHVIVDAAVAANFAAVAEGLAAAFEAETGVPVRVSVGSTGGLFAQIVKGAPYHLLLAADEARPARLEAEGRAVAGSRFVYAEGRLVVFAPRRDGPWAVPALLHRPGLRVAWADPRIAPYGAAAVAVLDAWGLQHLEGAVGESVSRVYQFARAGAVDAAFVAASQVLDEPTSSVRSVPPALYPPIRQSAVLLEPGRTVPEARAFLDFLRSEGAVARIRAAGYDVPQTRTEPHSEPPAPRTGSPSGARTHGQ